MLFCHWNENRYNVSWYFLSLCQDQAKEKYVGIVDDLVAQEGGEAETASATEGSLSFTGLKYTVDNGVATITLNRPNKKNAITTEVSKHLEEREAIKRVSSHCHHHLQKIQEKKMKKHENVHAKDSALIYLVFKVNVLKSNVLQKADMFFL